MIKELTKIISRNRIFGTLAMKQGQYFYTSFMEDGLGKENKSMTQFQKKQYTKKNIIKMSNKSRETKIFAWENERRFHIS